MILAFVLGEVIVHFKYPLWLLFTLLILFIVIITTFKFNLKLMVVILFSFIGGFVLITNQIESLEISKEIINSKEISYTGKIKNKIFKNEKYYYYIDDIIILSQKDENLKIGNVVNFKGEYLEFMVERNPGGFDEGKYYNSLGISYKIKSKSVYIMDESYNYLRESLYNIKIKLKQTIYQVAPKKEASIFVGMILGESYEIEKEAKELYRMSGIAHVLAISGLHISMIGLGVYKILRRRLFFLSASFLASLVVIAFVLMTGESASGIRAFIMFLILLIANVMGRTYDTLSAISLAAILILVDNPLILFNVGFLLSFMAVISIELLYPVFENTFEIESKVLKALCISFVATLGTAPIIACSFYELPTYGVLINLLILPFVGILMGSGLLAALVGSIVVELGIFLVGAGVIFLKFNEVICNIFSFLPYSNIVVGKLSTFNVIVYYFFLGILVFGIMHLEKKKAIISILLITVILVSLVYIKIPGKLQITVIDVGQGDGIFIENRNDDTFMIDGGSSNVKELAKYTIVPFLKSKGIGEIDYWIISHCDSDHTSGLLEILNNYKNFNIVIKNIIISDTEEEITQNTELLNLATNYDINIVKIKKGSIIKSGDLDLKCLHPYSGYKSESVNGYSIVLSLEYKDFNMLFTGDLEEDGESDLISNKLLDDYDIIKVAHHGSKLSTSKEFLDITKPEYSIISCGENNTYGHPHFELIKRLETICSKVFITTKMGAIRIDTDGKIYNVNGYIQN